MSRFLIIALLLFLSWDNVCTPRIAEAQMIQTAVPSQGLGSSYSEGASIRGSLQGRNAFANFGGGGPLLPPFGRAASGGGLSGGFGFSGGGISGSLRFNLGQQSSQSISSTSAALTTTDGHPGSLFSGTVRPFVTGWTPVVGQYATAISPMNAASQTAASIGQSQLSSLRQSQAVLHNKKLSRYLHRAERAEKEGNKRMARANYRSAIAITSGPLRTQLQLRLQKMLSNK